MRHIDAAPSADPCSSFETVEVVADGHGEGEEPFKCLPRVLELYCDPAGLQTYARGQGFKLLVDDGDRSLDDELGAFEAVAAQLPDQAGDFASPLDFVEGVLAGGDLLEAADKGIPVGQAAGSDTAGDAGGHDLLGAAAADAEQELESRAIDVGVGMVAQTLYDGWQLTVPDRFLGHGFFSMLVRDRAVYQEIICSDQGTGKDPGENRHTERWTACKVSRFGRFEIRLIQSRTSREWGNCR